MSQINPSSNMSLDEDDTIPNANKKENDDLYRIYLYNSNEPIYTIHDIDLYKNLSGYISVFTNDIKDKNIICPEFIEERELTLIIEFIEKYKDTMNYKINLVEDKYYIDLDRPVKDLASFKKQVGDCYQVIEKIFFQKLFLSVINNAMCFDVPILVDILCAKIALDIKYMTKSEINDYFKDAKK